MLSIWMEHDRTRVLADAHLIPKTSIIQAHKRDGARRLVGSSNPTTILRDYKIHRRTILIRIPRELSLFCPCRTKDCQKAKFG